MSQLSQNARYCSRQSGPSAPVKVQPVKNTAANMTSARVRTAVRGRRASMRMRSYMPRFPPVIVAAALMSSGLLPHVMLSSVRP